MAVYGDFTDVEVGTTFLAEQLTGINVDTAKVDSYQQGTVPAENSPPEWTEPNTDPGLEEGTAAPEAPGAQAYPVYEILNRWRDAFRSTNILRRGYYNSATDKGFGFDKVYWKHNLTQGAVMAITKYPRVRYPIGGTTYNYETDVLRIRCSGWAWWRKCKVVDHRVVVAGHDFRTIFDGSSFGIVTAFCRGEVRCPDWVKNAINI